MGSADFKSVGGQVTGNKKHRREEIADFDSSKMDNAANDNLRCVCYDWLLPEM